VLDQLTFIGAQATQSPRIWLNDRLGVIASGSMRQCSSTGRRVAWACARRRVSAGANSSVRSTRAPWPPKACA